MKDDWKLKSNKEKSQLAIQILSTTNNETIHAVCIYLSSLLSRDFLTCLPLELSLSILNYLDLKTVYTLLFVCKKYYQLCRMNCIWKRLYFANGFDIHHDYLEFNRNKNVASKDENEFPYFEQNALDDDMQVCKLDWKHILHQRIKLQNNWKRNQCIVHPFQAHLDVIYCLQFDSEKLITGSRDRSIMIWDLESRICIQTLHGHTGSVLCLKFDKDYLVTGSSDSAIFIWSLLDGRVICKLLSHSESILGLKFTREFIISCSKDCTIKIWDFSSGSLKNTLTGHRAAVNAIDYAHGLIVSASGGIFYYIVSYPNVTRQNN